LEALAEEGEYVYNAAGCAACHTRDEPGAAELAGGDPLETPFGVFHAPNITPDGGTGIGDWTAADFVTALRHGRSPDGRAYYPSFPYTSYATMDEADMLRLYAWIMRRVPPADAPSPDHELPWYLAGSLPARAWQFLYFEPREVHDTTQGEIWNRGSYLANALFHCGECHTPRNVLGAPIRDMYLAGWEEGAEGKGTPNITSDRETGIGGWSDRNVRQLLRFGMEPDGDSVGAGMGEVIDHLKQLTDDDLAALMHYLRTVPAVHRESAGH
jgi:mono/diheme cytochrome c family protein